MTNDKSVKDLQELTLGIIEESHEKFENVKIAPITLEIDGELKTYKIEVYKIFSPTKIHECITEFIKNIDRARRVDKEGFGSILEPYLLWFIVKHFTVSLGESMPSKFEEQIVSLKKMIETSALFQIIASFEENQIISIREHLEILIKNFENNHEEFKELKELFKKQLKDKTLLD